MPDQDDTTNDKPLDAEPTADAAAESVESGRGADLESARAEAADWRDKYLRKLAEFDNYRRRTRLESESLWQRASESVILALLPVMDDFERMLASVTDPDDFYRKGAVMIRDKLQAVFEANGVSPFEALGKPFDPTEHDAVVMQPVSGFPPGTIMNVIKTGYKMGDRVIRHAQVVVSAEPESETGSNSAADEASGQ
jgi:molecular chaperone GrpE